MTFRGGLSLIGSHHVSLRDMARLQPSSSLPLASSQRSLAAAGLLAPPPLIFPPRTLSHTNVIHPHPTRHDPRPALSRDTQVRDPATGAPLAVALTVSLPGVSRVSEVDLVVTREALTLRLLPQQPEAQVQAAGSSSAAEGRAGAEGDEASGRALSHRRPRALLRFRRGASFWPPSASPSPTAAAHRGGDASGALFLLPTRIYCAARAGMRGKP